MAITDLTRDALDLHRLQLPASPKVIRLDVEDYFDKDGEPSLRVLAVIDEATDLDHIDGRGVSQLKMAILESLQQHGIDLFPYIFLAKQSELAGDDVEG